MGSEIAFWHISDESAVKKLGPHTPSAITKVPHGSGFLASTNSSPLSASHVRASQRKLNLSKIWSGVK
ncbi:hypothetical protein C6558_27360 [Ensifer sp. NM-2]|jgi:hypothetical protein|nr:hypothetical protein ASD03_25785 [Ensifer sp. Root127]PSS61429.1 hypothetical protein C6558_27360 [Ensifer sp. NM-2]